MVRAEIQSPQASRTSISSRGFLESSFLFKTLILAFASRRLETDSSSALQASEKLVEMAVFLSGKTFFRSLPWERFFELFLRKKLFLGRYLAMKLCDILILAKTQPKIVGSLILAPHLL